MANNTYKTIDTTLSTYSDVNSSQIQKSKQYLTEHYGNQYDSPPHVTYSICPFPEQNLPNIEKEMSQYFNKIQPFSFTFGKLQFDERMKFFYLPITNAEVQKIHKDMTNLSNKYREGFLREKDVDRLSKGYYNEKQKDNITKYGYARVFNESKLHITIGNILTEVDHYSHIKENLELILGDLNNAVEVSEVVVHFQKHLLDNNKSVDVRKNNIKLEGT